MIQFPGEDIRDRVLRAALANINNVKSAQDVLGLNRSEILDTIDFIKNDKRWLLVPDRVNGIFFIYGEYKKEVEEFLKNGGYSKIEYLNPITDEERLQKLKLIETQGELSLTYLEWAFQYNRERQIIKSLKVRDLIELSSTKMDYTATISDKGTIALENGYIEKPAAAHSFTHIEKIFGDKIAGDKVAGDKVEGIKSTGDGNVTTLAKDKANVEQVFQKEKGSFVATWLAPVVVGLVIIFVSWFFGCNS